MEMTGIILFCEDIKSLTSFYRDVLGLIPDDLQPFPPHKFYRFKFKKNSKFGLCLHSGTKPNGGRQKLTFDVKSVNDIYEKLKKSGRRPKKVVDTGEKTLVYDFKDPEGNRIQIYGPY